MSEPFLPVPPVEPNDYWEPEPARCIECGSIVDPRPQPSGELLGWCSTHGLVDVIYHGDSQETENEEEG